MKLMEDSKRRIKDTSRELCCSLRDTGTVLLILYGNVREWQTQVTHVPGTS